jgi:hypothetical protein
MDDARFVRRLQSFGDLFRDGQRVVDRNRSLRDAVGESRPRDELQDQGAGIVTLLDAVDGHDAGVVETGEDLRFSLEPGEPIWILREGVRQGLQRDLAVELGVGRLPHLSHATLANEGGHGVVTKASAGTQSHSAVKGLTPGGLARIAPGPRTGAACVPSSCTRL